MSAGEKSCALPSGRSRMLGVSLERSDVSPPPAPARHQCVAVGVPARVNAPATAPASPVRVLAESMVKVKVIAHQLHAPNKPGRASYCAPTWRWRRDDGDATMATRRWRRRALPLEALMRGPVQPPRK